MRNVKKGIIIGAFAVIAVIVAAAVFLTGNTRDQAASLDEKAELTITEQELAPSGNTKSETPKENPDQSASSERRLTKQETDALINEMSDSLSDLEETVDSLDDVSDSDLEIPEE